MRFFPLVFSLFMFVLFANLFGMFPYFFTVTSHIIVTFALAMLVIGTVIVYGFMKHGFGFLKLFVPEGIPGALVPLVVMIEVISFLSRPISLSVRLFANMLAGHITLKVFAGFVVSLTGLGVVGIGGAILPLLMTSCHDGAGVPRILPAGVCVCGAYLHVPQRRASPLTLINPSRRPRIIHPGRQAIAFVHSKGVQSWKQKQQNSSALVSHVSAWAALQSALARFSATICRAPCATRQPLMASSAVSSSASP
jgi:hypothetical protein